MCSPRRLRRGARRTPARPADAYTAWMASDDAGGEPPAKSYEEEIAGCRSQAAATAFCVDKRPDLATHLPWAIAAVATACVPRLHGTMMTAPAARREDEPHAVKAGSSLVNPPANWLSWPVLPTRPATRCS